MSPQVPREVKGTVTALGHRGLVVVLETPRKEHLAMFLREFLDWLNGGEKDHGNI